MLDKRNVADEFKLLDDERIRMLYNNEALPFAVCCVNLSGGLNVGGMMRTANFYGAGQFLYLGRKHIDRRSAVGVYNYTTVNYLADLNDLAALKNEYKLIGIENNVENCQPYNSFNYPANSLFLFGEEGSGLDKELLDMCDAVLYIKRAGGGTVRSLNVAASCAIILNDYATKYEAK